MPHLMNDISILILSFNLSLIKNQDKHTMNILTRRLTLKCSVTMLNIGIYNTGTHHKKSMIYLDLDYNFQSIKLYDTATPCINT